MSLKNTDPKVFNAILKEAQRQNDNIELIASENFVNEDVLEAQGSIMTNKYAEGYPDARWYGGCEYVDIVEKLAIERARNLFLQNVATHRKILNEFSPTSSLN